MIFCFGACENGHNIKKIIEKSGDRKVDYYVDNNEKKQGHKLDGIEIISFDAMREKCKRKKFVPMILIALLNPETVVDQIRESQFNADVYVLTKKYIISNARQEMEFKDALCKIDEKLHRLGYLEVHVAHHCNLKCKGCGHMSNIVPVEFPDFEQYKKDLYQLRKFFWGVKRFRLLGGEPLLNPQLSEYIIETRKVFPDADIRVVTNGLLIPTLGKDVLQTMKRESVEFDISCYHPTARIKEQIELRCIEHEVRYQLSSEIDVFFKRCKDTEEKDPYIAYNVCESKNCHFMLDGKISLCPAPILVEKFKEYTVGTAREGDIIDLYDRDITSERLYYLMTHPNHQCAYCSDEKEWFDWEGNSKTNG